MLFKVKERKFMSDKTYIMGILNITPDSFSDGGKYDNLESALVKAMELEEQGADIIDIGGESSRPGAKEVSLEEEIQRVIPLIKKIREESKIPISIDTYKPEVARQAMEAGADIINYIKGYSIDSKMLDVVEEHECPFVLMHMRGTPENMQQKTDYNALMGDMISEITPVYDKLVDLLGNPGKIIIDPGIGFGKTVEDNWKIIKELQTLKVMGSPVLLGASRKSFIGKTFSIDNIHERDIITSFISQFAIQSGVNFIRVHNVELHKKLIETMIYMGVCDDRV
ncbi:MAG: dihydropteroate synthase [Candidatus Muiribacterium halophilum]|uniref:Dihydropteroate synthase n=1 Tax=Muiribacterium halophilum TaxID=2053465 RepID=A0A2N5Z9G6_MUIH1|nr:MAG: dihydropteroate synthase [Candidatus Muirbacterium halophilum]